MSEDRERTKDRVRDRDSDADESKDEVEAHLLDAERNYGGRDDEEQEEGSERVKD